MKAQLAFTLLSITLVILSTATELSCGSTFDSIGVSRDIASVPRSRSRSNEVKGESSISKNQQTWPSYSSKEEPGRNFFHAKKSSAETRWKMKGAELEQKYPRDITYWMNQRKNKSSDNIVVFTTMSDTEMDQLRELVGSVHAKRKNNTDLHVIVVYAFNLSQKQKREILLWRNVEVVDADETLFLGGNIVPATATEQENKPSALQHRRSARVVLAIFELLLKKYHTVMYLRVDYALFDDTLHEISAASRRHGFFCVTEFHDVHASPPKRQPIDSVATRASDDSFELSGFEDAAAWSFASGSKATELFVSLHLQCIRGFHCDPWLRGQLVEAQREMLRKHASRPADFSLQRPEIADLGTKFHCYTLLRDEILYSAEYLVGDLAPEDSINSNNNDDGPRTSLALENPLSSFPRTVSGKIPIAVGMPTLSANDLKSHEEVSPARIMVPSLLRTITTEEWHRFEYWVYLGFDEGDAFFDDANTREKIHDFLTALVRDVKAKVGQHAAVHFKYMRFPFSKGWVTSVWNGLFVQAMRDGAHYFYQVNDDLELSSNGWTSYFTASLVQNDNVGVAGPWDRRQSGKLLTQAFVSRKHYFTFGRLYPLDLKDWYSDNWLNDVYGPENRFSTEGITADNKNDKGTRYIACREQPRYNDILSAGQRVLADWLHDFHSLKKRAPGSTFSDAQYSGYIENSGTARGNGYERLRMEMRMGPLL